MKIGKNAHLLSYFLKMKKKVEKCFPGRGGGGGVKILSSILDNVHYRNEINEMCRIIKYICKAIFLQNLLVNYTKQYLPLIQTNINEHFTNKRSR